MNKPTKREEFVFRAISIFCAISAGLIILSMIFWTNVFLYLEAFN